MVDFRKPHLVWDFLKTAGSMKSQQSKSLMRSSKMSVKSAKNTTTQSKDSDFWQYNFFVLFFFSKKSIYRPIPEKLKQKVVGPISLAKQKSR